MFPRFPGKPLSGAEWNVLLQRTGDSAKSRSPSNPRLLRFVGCGLWFAFFVIADPLSPNSRARTPTAVDIDPYRVLCTVPMY